MSRLRRVADWYARQPLRARLVAIIAILLAVGLGLMGGVTRAIVSHNLMQQVDHQLLRTAADGDALNQTISQATAGPSDYYVLLRTSLATRSIFWQPTVNLNGEPVIPELTQEEVEERAGEPFTVPATGGAQATQWRVVAVAVTVPPLRQPGVVYVALPLTQVHGASQILTFTLLTAGGVIIVLGAAAAWVLVRRSLRPLQEMETTAAAIAAGDLTRRVPPSPPTTEVGSLGQSLNAMLAQIEAAFAAREESERRMRRFVSDASHELRTPLATIRGYGELYRMGALDSEPKVEDTMGRIEDAARRMGRLVNDLLELARLDENRPLRREPVDLAAMANDAAQDLRALDPTRTVTVTHGFSSSCAKSQDPGLTAPVVPAPLVTGDPDRLRQVLTNLVGNVARHTPPGTPAELTVGLSDDGAATIVEVRDHGPGVTPEQAARMFERFYRVDSSRNHASGGSGLGLAIVAAIVGAHGGHVSVDTPDDGGLTVRLELPTAVVGDDGADAQGSTTRDDGEDWTTTEQAPLR